MRAALREQPRTTAIWPASRPSQPASVRISRSASPRRRSAAATPSRPGRRVAVIRLGRQFGPEPLAQRGAPLLAAALVGEHPPGDPVQPRPGVLPGRDVVDPPPGGEERLGDDVGGVVGVAGPAQRVAEDGGVVDGVHLLEPPSRVVGHPLTRTAGRTAMNDEKALDSSRCWAGASPQHMSGTPPAVSSSRETGSCAWHPGAAPVQRLLSGTVPRGRLAPLRPARPPCCRKRPLLSRIRFAWPADPC